MTLTVLIVHQSINVTKELTPVMTSLTQNAMIFQVPFENLNTDVVIYFLNRYTTLWRFRATRILGLEIFDQKLRESAHFRIFLALNW